MEKVINRQTFMYILNVNSTVCFNECVFRLLIIFIYIFLTLYLDKPATIIQYHIQDSFLQWDKYLIFIVD